jgi:hypothetical protein
LGVIGVIYESRPNVTADAGALCLKSGNAVILRGGSDSFHSSRAIHACLVRGLESAGLPADAIQMIPVSDRAAVGELLTGLGGTVDVIVPRGGKSLVARVQADARVPVFAHLEGPVPHLCRQVGRSGHGARHRGQRQDAPHRHLRRPKPCCSTRAGPRGGGWHPGRSCRCRLRNPRRHGCRDGPSARGNACTEDDWRTEYLDAIIAARFVDGIDGAIDHIANSSSHTEAVIAEDLAVVERFFNGSGFRHPAAQRLDPVRRWWRIRHGRGDRHRHRQDACARARRRRATDLVQVPRARHGPDPALNGRSARSPSYLKMPHVEPGMSVGLFGGSFNPPHQGHELVAEIALRRLGSISCGGW